MTFWAACDCVDSRTTCTHGICKACLDEDDEYFDDEEENDNANSTK
jgi:hypothetical protein